jgi:hypothetical protein
MNVVVDEKKKTITITVPLQDPKASKSGKTKVIASLTGETDQTFKGKPVHVSLNAYVKK